MKTRLLFLLPAIILWSSLSPTNAQSTAFTYQGRLNSGTNPATGSYDMTFAVFDASTGGTQQGGLATISAIPVSNGLFTATLDLGNNFPGADRWLEIAVRTNSGGALTTLTPRQKITATPYAIQSIKAGTATSFGGSLGGDVTGTQSATLVSTVGTVTAANIAAGANAANAATSANTANTIVKRDANGNLAAGTITASVNGNGSGLTSLNANNLASGTVSDQRLSSNVALRSGGNSFSGTQTFSNLISSAGGLRLNDSNIWFRGGSDLAHGLAYNGGLVTNFGNGNVQVDGPVLWGYAGGALGTFNPVQHAMLTWTRQQVLVNSTNVGGWPNSVAFIENKSSDPGSAAPAQRLQAAGNLVDGVLSVSSTTGVGYIARFGNQAGYLLDITTNGNVQASGTVTAGGFSGPGAMSWQTVSGTSQTAQPNKGYLLTNDAQVTVTLPASANLNEVLRVSGTGVNGWKIAQNAGQSVVTKNLFGTIGVNWIERDTYRNWQGAASSADGSNLVATVNGGQIYTSTDAGVTWTARDSNRIWQGVASSADGTKLVAVVSNGQIYTSTDSGVTWTARDSNRSWQAVASSALGGKLVATVYGGQIYASIDAGATWTPYASVQNWRGVASSSDGSKLVAVAEGGQIYTSTDNGFNWIARDFNRGWNGVASSADGTKLVAAAYTGQIYTSTDSGVTWTARDSNRGWLWVASSADGTKLVATTWAATLTAGQIYTSADSGVTWTARNISRLWGAYGIASSADGTKLVATVYNGHIYTAAPPDTSSVNSTTVGTAGYLLGDQGSAIELQFIGNGRFQPISHEGFIGAY